MMSALPRSILGAVALFLLLLPDVAHSYNLFGSSDRGVDNPEELLASNVRFDDAIGSPSDSRKRDSQDGASSGSQHRRMSLEEHFYGRDAGSDLYQHNLLEEQRQTISSGLHHTCAVTYRAGVECGEHPCGPVKCFGSDAHGESSPPPGVVFDQISSGGYFSCGLKAGGKIACWGDIDHPPTSLEMLSSDDFDTYKHARRMQHMEAGAHFASSKPVAGGDYYVQVSSGLKHACAISRDREVHCWGRNDYGESNPPKGSFVQISAGHSFTCGIRPNREVQCWGKNDVGQSSPPSFPQNMFRQVSASLGGDHACGLRDDGGIACWGNNGRGQSEMQDGNYLQVSAGTRTTCAIRADSDTDSIGDESNSVATSIHCWGSRAAIVLDHFNDKESQQEQMSHHQISLGQDHACVSNKSVNELPGTPRTLLECWWMAGSDFNAHRVPVGLEMVA